MSANVSGFFSDKKVRVNAIDPPKELNITGTGVTVTDNPALGRYDIVISGGGGGGSGTLNSVSNVGSGTGQIFRDITSSTTINLKTLKAGTNVSLINNANDVTISTTTTSTPLAKGTATKSGDSSTKVFTIPHGMSTTPVFASVIPTSSDALGTFITSWDSTNITITYSLPPPATASSNLTYAWIAMDVNGGGGALVETKGATTFSGDGSTKTFTIAHTLASVPSVVIVRCSSLPDNFTYTFDSTNINIVFPFPPPSGSNNIIFQWLTKV